MSNMFWVEVSNKTLPIKRVLCFESWHCADGMSGVPVDATRIHPNPVPLPRNTNPAYQYSVPPDLWPLRALPRGEICNRARPVPFVARQCAAHHTRFSTPGVLSTLCTRRQKESLKSSTLIGTSRLFLLRCVRGIHNQTLCSFAQNSQFFTHGWSEGGYRCETNRKYRKDARY